MSVLNLSWGSPIVDRRSKVHLSSRVSLPQSLVSYDNSDEAVATPSRNTPIVSRSLGIFAFVTCAAVVIATASFLALSI